MKRLEICRQVAMEFDGTSAEEFDRRMKITIQLCPEMHGLLQEEIPEAMVERERAKNLRLLTAATLSQLIDPEAHHQYVMSRIMKKRQAN